MNRAWPPSRSSGMTGMRAAWAAAAEPWSPRIMCGHMSTAPAVTRRATVQLAMLTGVFNRSGPR
jgi:hypothetical protein